MKGNFPIQKLRGLQTPFYFYDTQVLRNTLELVKQESSKYGYQVHYAVKANANARILSIIREYGLGADCVSGGEIKAALQAGFPTQKVVFAGVGKADWEIDLGLDSDIFCFNAESIPELEVIDELAQAKNKIARIALRINPEIDAHTHHHISTGLKENKFGINLSQLDEVIDRLKDLNNLKLVGIHFHIGSQLGDLTPYHGLCARINDLQEQLAKQRIVVEHINVGGGLGVDYHHPNRQPYPDFKEYFGIFNRLLKLNPGQTLHFEPGRSIVGQCGSLITKVLYVKEGSVKKFAITDAGMTELIRPALYQAYHKIENITSEGETDSYDVVGPICESSDCFGKAVDLNKTQRGDLLAIRSAGAYGEIMASQYNCRKLPASYFSDNL